MHPSEKSFLHRCCTIAARLAQSPTQIQKILYTASILGSYLHQLRKVTKDKAIFPIDDALMKMLYLMTQDVMNKWTGRVHNNGIKKPKT